MPVTRLVEVKQHKGVNGRPKKVPSAQKGDLGYKFSDLGSNLVTMIIWALI